ncbi:putative dithiol-disulfide oxidoreductase (DUF899 family) [Sphingopyxis panaciterrae]|uniref:DUF899 family protein n=1 Tax=Sphingopyxis panaciterrae TaxID=363841 RepID=UPI001421A8FC|nr:DUF899 family protein [Sphingopyxis panaciterrae]NIJ39076.1 putative dithiol-disulfide oxidoreductase (DUF899 family) [Sphingopyxis panaciterrae]
MEHLSFPNESAAYRAARIALLDEEIALRRQIEAVAAQRRTLPPGGEIPEDYSFERIGAYQRPERVTLSQLFGDKPSIIVQSFMFGPERDKPCNGCTHMLDAIDGAARHVGQRAPLYVVAKSPIARLEAWAKDRRWPHLVFLSDVDGRYSADYFGDTSKISDAKRAERGMKPDENWDETIFNVFRNDGGAIRHVWASEMAYAPDDPGQHHRAGDLVDPLWGLLDMTPEGRGDWFPSLTY